MSTEKDNNNITLSELAEGAANAAKPTPQQKMRPKLDTSSIKDANLAEAVIQSEPAPVVGTGNPMLDKAFEGLEEAIVRTQQETNDTYQKGLEQRIEESLDEDDDIDDIDNEAVSNNNIVVHKDAEEQIETPMVEQTVRTASPVAGTRTETISMPSDQSVYDEADDEHLFDGIDDEDLKLLDDEEETEEEKEEDEEEKAKTEAIKENIRHEMDKNFNPVIKKVDLSTYTIAAKPINAAKVINEIKTKAIECADGVLWHTKRAVRMSSWAPMEIQSIDPARIRNGNYNKYIENKLRLIYDHIVDANKPATFEAWAMITPNTVIDDYMFTAYKATFGLTNILTYSCDNEECNNVFMEPVPIHSMIKFTSDEVKEQYMKILHEGNTDSTGDHTYPVDLYQISDEYVVGLKTPSVYNVYIEPTLVPQEFNSKYEDRLLLLSYIDNIYKIDETNHQLIRIDTKPVKTDKSLTYKRRIKTFDTILKSLTSDQLMTLSTYTDKYDGGKLNDDGELVTDVTYIYPERICTKCGKKIKEQVVNPDNMLFTRHQLGLMKKI